MKRDQRQAVVEYVKKLHRANKIAVDRATRLQLELDAARAEIVRLKKGVSK